MSDFHEFMHYRVLAYKFDALRGDKLSDALLSSIPDDQGPPRQNVCAKLDNGLCERLDQVVNFLGISKRLFIERALIEALDQVEVIMEAHQLPDELEAFIARGEARVSK